KFTGEMIDAAQHLARPYHLRDRLRRDEGADLDGVEARAKQLFDEGDATGDADGGLLVLQPVAWAHFDDAYGIVHNNLTPQARLLRARRLPARHRRPCI